MFDPGQTSSTMPRSATSDPSSGGVLIDSAQTISGTLAGGDEARVSASWIVPNDGQAHQGQDEPDEGRADEDGTFVRHGVPPGYGMPLMLL